MDIGGNGRACRLYLPRICIYTLNAAKTSEDSITVHHMCILLFVVKIFLLELEKTKIVYAKNSNEYFASGKNVNYGIYINKNMNEVKRQE